jgi:hypothetical protein
MASHRRGLGLRHAARVGDWRLATGRRLVDIGRRDARGLDADLTQQLEATR